MIPTQSEFNRSATNNTFCPQFLHPIAASRITMVSKNPVTQMSLALHHSRTACIKEEYFHRLHKNISGARGLTYGGLLLHQKEGLHNFQHHHKSGLQFKTSTVPEWAALSYDLTSVSCRKSICNPNPKLYHGPE